MKEGSGRDLDEGERMKGRENRGGKKLGVEW